MYIILIYVDKILLLAEEQEIKQIKEVFLKHFTWITMEVAESIPFLEC